MIRAERTKRLRVLREKHDLSAEDIAELLDRSQSIVKHWLSGRYHAIPRVALELLEYKLGERSSHERAQ